MLSGNIIFKFRLNVIEKIGDVWKCLLNPLLSLFAYQCSNRVHNTVFITYSNSDLYRCPLVLQNCRTTRINPQFRHYELNIIIHSVFTEYFIQNIKFS